ncbi:putative transcription factor FAR family [Helianthus annuus]|nr:putative transcription factor FAR family [Helianthus annuus]
MMYNTYATQSGFSTRIGTSKNKKYHDNPNTKISTHRYILCSREGQPRVTESDPNAPSKNAPTIYDKSKKQHRRSRFTVSGCRARIKVRFDRATEQYKIYGFIATHNHCMIGSDHANMLKQNRILGFEEQQFIHKVSLNKIGPTVAHNIQASLKGGPQNVRGTTEDFKNCSRDIRAFIGERDADILLHTMRSRVTNLNDFYFDCVIVDNELRSFFWADFVSLRNYEAFGDIQNDFCAITGVDHHKKCVIFGAGMLYDETIESYTWLLNTFLAAHKKQPIFVLTDQDASMKQAVSTVFTNSIHRLCMWHIMRKLPSKISNDILDNTTLRSSIHKLVWNLFITPQTFEERWHVLMDEYHLDNHPWLCEMFAIRHEWVPCYFREIPMCCLMKTTSRCESSNARFKVNSSETNTLVQFLMCFETSIDAQRHTQRDLEFKSDMSTPRLSTGLRIEAHASETYTWSMFLEVRKEIYMGMFHCMPIERPGTTDVKNYTVRHCKSNMSYVNEFEVSLNVPEQTVSCTCLGFTRIGYLCRHVFCIFRYHQIERIPSHYIIPRWKRDALPSVVHSVSNIYSSNNSEFAIIHNEIMDLVTQCTTRLRRNPDQLRSLSSEIKRIRNRVFESFPCEPQPRSVQKTANISDILNIPSNLSKSVHPPQGIRNKGCGTKKQRIGPGGQNIKDKQKKAGKRQKAARLCNKCNKYVFDHDSRNCEKIKAAKLAARAAKRASAIAAGLPASSDSDSDDTDVDLDDTDDDTNDDIDEYNSSDYDASEYPVSMQKAPVPERTHVGREPEQSFEPDQNLRRSTRRRKPSNIARDS